MTQDPEVLKRRRIAAVRFLVPALAVITAAAWVHTDDLSPISGAPLAAWWAAFLVRTFTFHIGLAEAGMGLAAWWLGMPRLMIAGLALGLLMMAPEIPTGAPARVQDPVRIMSVNLLMVNRNVEPILAEIGAADPEVVLLQEYTDHWHEAWVKAHGKRYPHGGHVNREDSFGIAIWSKRPLADVRVDVPIGDGSTPQMRAVMQHAGRPIALYNVHLLPPRTFSYLAGHRMEVRNLVSLLEAEKLPAIVTGDFNFSMRTPQADRLLAAGYVDAHRSAGRGRGATWPVIGITRYVPGVQLDHVFLRGPLACARVETGEGRGSDHRPLMVELGWTP